MTPQVSVRQLERDLRVALRPHRAKAHELATWLATGVESFRDDEASDKKNRSAAARSADVAEAMQRYAKKLQDAFELHDRIIRGALVRGYIAPSFSIEEMKTLGDMMSGSWRARSACRSSLADVISDTQEWGRKARLAARRPPGRPIGDRLILAEWVALALRLRGVPLTKARNGIFARVLRVVYEAVGRDVTDLFRDVTKAIQFVSRQSDPDQRGADSA